MKKQIHSLLFSATLLMGVAAHAQVRVEIAGVSGTQIPVAVAAFADESVAPDQVSNIIRADLERSGVFKVIDAGRAISDSASVDLGAFKASGADALVVGSVSRLADGRFQVRYKLLDTVKQTQLSQLSDAVGARSTRLEAHRIADDIYEKLTGVRGIYSTRISYVTATTATSWWWPTPTARTNRWPPSAASRSSRRPGRRTAPRSPTSRSRSRSRSSTCRT
jgi:TolB protein